MGASAAIGVLTAVGIILSMIDLKFIQDSFIGKFELAAPVAPKRAPRVTIKAADLSAASTYRGRHANH